MMFEHKSEPLLPPGEFAGRVALSVLLGGALIAVSLLAGIAGFHYIVGCPWIEAFLNASMLLGGMGPVGEEPSTEGGKLFAGFYALYCGLVVLIAAGIIFAPVAHRILHRFHLEEQDD